jgi:hypothetical protein
MPLRNQFRHHPVTVAFRAFGVDAAVTVPDAGWRAEVSELLPPGAVAKAAAAGDARFALTPTPTGTYDVSVGDEPRLRDGDRDVALGFLDAQLRLYVADQAPDHVFIHAGVVAWDGRALMLAGESFSGKTTLVGALVAAGAEYLSDEFAVLDASGQVHPYPRRLSLRGNGGSAGVEGDAAGAGEAGAHGEAAAPAAATPAGPVQLAGVVLTRYSPDGDWQPEAISRAQGCLAVLEYAVPARNRPQASLDAIDRALADATVLSGVRGEAEVTAQRIVERFGWLGSSTVVDTETGK